MMDLRSDYVGTGPCEWAVWCHVCVLRLTRVCRASPWPRCRPSLTTAKKIPRDAMCSKGKMRICTVDVRYGVRGQFGTESGRKRRGGAKTATGLPSRPDFIPSRPTGPSRESTFYRIRAGCRHDQGILLIETPFSSACAPASVRVSSEGSV